MLHNFWWSKQFAAYSRIAISWCNKYWVWWWFYLDVNKIVNIERTLISQFYWFSRYFLITRGTFMSRIDKLLRAKFLSIPKASHCLQCICHFRTQMWTRSLFRDNEHDQCGTDREYAQFVSQCDSTGQAELHQARLFSNGFTDAYTCKNSHISKFS